ncbi:superoxide dismutase [Obelidium mucronatum]|nr:superoxide dismutase [Obelidium mucronatum]
MATAAAFFSATLLSPPTFSADLIFSQKANSAGVSVALRAAGLPPNKRFGFHIHEFGDSSDAAGALLGAHFNPTNAAHGCPNSDNNNNSVHYGDLGWIASDSNGIAVKTWMLPHLSLIDAHALGFVLGRGIVIHENEDDCVSQPSGGKGGRIAQGVIGINDYRLKQVPDSLELSVLDAVAVFRDNDSLDQVVTGTIRILRKAAESGSGLLLLALDGLGAQAAYQLAVYDYAVTTDLNTAIPTLCKSSTPFTTDSSGKTSCTLRFPPAISNSSIQSFLGKSLVILPSSTDCSATRIISSAPIGAAKPMNQTALSNFLSCPSDSLSNTTSGSSLVLPILALVTSLIVLALAVGFSCLKMYQGYSRLDDPNNQKESDLLVPLKRLFRK